jgi:hypothetical protein
VEQPTTETPASSEQSARAENTKTAATSQTTAAVATSTGTAVAATSKSFAVAASAEAQTSPKAPSSKQSTVARDAVDPAVSDPGGRRVVLTDPNDWTLNGNANATASSYIGTPAGGANRVQIKVQGTTLFSAEQLSGSVNIIAGLGNGTVSGTIGATILGGGGAYPDGNLVDGNFGTIVGGRKNVARWDSFVGGGQNNKAEGQWTTVAGGSGNRATGRHSIVAGGESNTAGGLVATVAGGYGNSAGGNDSFVGGGHANTASHQSATVAGGWSNTANTTDTTIGGGYSNLASGNSATIGGGHDNTASGQSATVAGGWENQATSVDTSVGGGARNIASGAGATVVGGSDNSALGNYSIVLGGRNNYVYPAATGSVAAGTGTSVAYKGCFAFSDQSGNQALPTADNQFVIRSHGGAYFYSGVNTGVTLVPATGTWTNLSDRASKRDIQAVDPESVLSALSKIPISTWSYREEPGAVRHMGPMAQDFHSAFHLGNSDKHITTIDLDGVALAAIQGLGKQTEKLRGENAALRLEANHLNEKVNRLEERLSRFEASARSSGSSLPDGSFAFLMLGLLGSGLAFARLKRE